MNEATYLIIIACFGAALAAQGYNQAIVFRTSRSKMGKLWSAQ